MDFRYSFYSILVLFLFVLLYSCNSDSKKEKADSITLENSGGMRDPAPVVVDQPRALNDLSIFRRDTSLYMIEIERNKIFIVHAFFRNKITNCNELDIYLKRRGGSKLNGKITLKGDSLASLKLIDSTLKVLKDNQIIQFNLITDLEK